MELPTHEPFGEGTHPNCGVLNDLPRVFLPVSYAECALGHCLDMISLPTVMRLPGASAVRDMAWQREETPLDPQALLQFEFLPPSFPLLTSSFSVCLSDRVSNIPR
jgi:hypothetical protein